MKKIYITVAIMVAFEALNTYAGVSDVVKTGARLSSAKDIILVSESIKEAECPIVGDVNFDSIHDAGGYIQSVEVESAISYPGTGLWSEYYYTQFTAQINVAFPDKEIVQFDVKNCATSQKYITHRGGGGLL